MNEPRVLRLPLGLLTLLYLALPLPVFFAGWLKPGWAILAFIPLLYCGWHLVRAWPVEPAAFRGGDVLFLAVVSLAVTAFAGIGGFAPQTTDWIKHNAVLFDCVNLPWPVVLADGPEKWPLVYYLAYYLPAAVAGKVAGYAAAQTALWVWTSGGVMLALCWFVRLTGLSARVAAPAFFFISGLVFAGNILVQILGLADDQTRKYFFYPNEVWARIWQLPNHYWSLEWAPGQALAAWLSAGMFLGCPKPLRPACFAWLFTCDLLWSPFAGVGLCLLAFFLTCREGLEWPVKLPGPILALILPFGVLVAFFKAKTAPEVAARFAQVPVAWFTRFHAAPGLLQSVFLLVVFVVLAFGIFLWFIRARFPRGTGERKLADACGLSLLCLLPVTVGYYSDLAMRAGAVPWFCLVVLTVRTMMPGGLPPKLRRGFGLILLIGAMTPLIEAAHQGYHLVTRQYDPGVVPHQVSAVVNMSDGGFNMFGAQYVGATNSFFARTLGR